MRIIPLMEDYMTGEHLIAEHGLCIYVETGKHKLLVDTGQSPNTWENAKHKGVDLKQVDTIFLSHGHYDHSSGLLSFVEKNPNAKIYMKDTAGGEYYHLKSDGEHYIGIDKDILKLQNVARVTSDQMIDEELSVFTNVTGRRLWPKGNLKLHKKIKVEMDTQGDSVQNGFALDDIVQKDSTQDVFLTESFVQDDFAHEMYLVIREADKLVLISGCAHNGILNIMDRFREIYHQNPDIVISGFHMVQKEYSEEDLAQIREVAAELANMKTTFFTGHCTGEVSFAIMKEIMGDQLIAISEM